VEANPSSWIRRIEERDDRIIGVIEQWEDDERESFFVPVDGDAVQVVRKSKSARFYAKRGHKVDF
jgi:hypothetical protein